MSDFAYDWMYDDNGNVVGMNGQQFDPVQPTTGGPSPPTPQTGNTSYTGTGGGPTETATATAPPAAAGTVDAHGNVSTGTGTTNVVTDAVNQSKTPVLPPGTKVEPKAQTVKEDELLKRIDKLETDLAAKDKAKIDFTPQQARTAGADFAALQAAATQNASYDAALIGENVPQAVAAHGAVTSEMTVAGQLSRLMDFGEDDMPFWAVGARRVAEEAMAARGLGASSIAGAAITQAIMEAGIPIAQADAQIYSDVARQNLSNQQQTLLQNVQIRQSAMLSDQAAQNAARQFNATSRTQTAQFFANLIAETDRFNASQVNAMNQFNATQTVTMGVEGWKLDAAIEQFNAEQINAMNKFYQQNQLLIDQSNAAWRRSVNTANTQNDNEAQRINATNLLGISNTNMNNLWQMFRDQASWVFQASENDADRAANMAIAAFNRDTQYQMQRTDNNFAQKQALFRTAGQFAINILSSMFGGG